MKKEQLVQLLNEMTLEEKINQLLQLSADFYTKDAKDMTGPLGELAIDEQVIQQAGSVLGVSGAEEIKAIQRNYMEQHRLGIPLLFMADVVHGYKTIFPIPLAIGSSWNLDMAEQVATISAKEAAVSGLHVTFSPMVDLVRDPRWGRVMESTGEDAFLNSRFAERFVRGYQGTDLTHDHERVAACVKHFAAYGAPVGGRDYNTVEMPERVLRSAYLPSFIAAIDAGVKLVMTAFNTVDGMPASGNKWLLDTLLRQELGFDGVIISDWGAVKELLPHGVAQDEAVAAQLALDATVDIEMMTSCYPHSLANLLEQNKITMAQIDAAVLRVLELKNDLGLFEQPYRGADGVREQETILSQPHREAARSVAAASMVLLQNNGVLPLKREQTVALIGPAAASQDILGEWSWHGETTDAVSLQSGMARYASNLLVATTPCDYTVISAEMIAAAVAVAQQADVVVLALGETSAMSGEAASRSDIRVPQAQIALYEAIKALGKEIIVTLYNGRPLDLTQLHDAAALVEAWFPGSEGGNALADILYGTVNPSGRLTMSFPASIGQVPIYYNVDNTGRPYEANPTERYVSKYLDVSNYPLFPFGYGLSYGKVQYGEVVLSDTVMKASETLRATITIENMSDYMVTETVQLYVRDVVGDIVRPLKELKGFEQVQLQPHEQREVVFTITDEMLQYVHRDLQTTSDAGEFIVMIGANSRDVHTATFKLTKSKEQE